MTLYDDMMQGAIDVHCHIDFEFSAKERKREPEFLWLPRAEAMGMRGVVLKSHWWPTVNVTPYILSSVQTDVALWSSVTLNSTAGGPNPCIIDACAALGGKMVFLPTWSARNSSCSRLRALRCRSTCAPGASGSSSARRATCAGISTWTRSSSTDPI